MLAHRVVPFGALLAALLASPSGIYHNTSKGVEIPLCVVNMIFFMTFIDFWRFSMPYPISASSACIAFDFTGGFYDPVCLVV